MNIFSRITDRFLAWHLKPADTQNFDFLDGLRGLAVLLVIGCHILYVNPKSNAWVQFLGGVFDAGSCGVTLFFALSGFLVSLPFWKRKQTGQAQLVPTAYGKRRFFKIYPPLVLSIVLLTPIYFYIEPDPALVIAAVKWLVAAPIFFPVSGSLNPVMWSLIVEVQFYMLLPVVMLLFRKVPLRTSVWMIPLLLAAIGVSSRYTFAAYGIYGSIHPNVYVPPLSGLDTFALGVLVAGLHAMGAMKPSWARLGNVGLVLLLVMLFVISWIHLVRIQSDALNETVNTILKIAFGCMLCFVAGGESLAMRALCNPLLRWFGIVSYEWYLFHQPIFTWFRKAFGPANGSPLTYLLITGGSFATSLLLAAVVYKYYSLPILVLGRDRRKTPA